jgi:hypothetical protein
MFENKTITFLEAENYLIGLNMLISSIEKTEDGVSMDLSYLLKEAPKRIKSQLDSVQEIKKSILEKYGTLDQNGTLTLTESNESIVEAINSEIRDFQTKSDEFTVIKNKIKLDDIKHLRIKPSFIDFFGDYIEGVVYE